jgi:hypothetical protein
MSTLKPIVYTERLYVQMTGETLRIQANIEDSIAFFNYNKDKYIFVIFSRRS